MGKQKRKRSHCTPGTPGSKYLGIGTRPKWDFCLRHHASPENHPLASLQSLHLFFFLNGASLAFTAPAFQKFWKPQILTVKPLPIQNIYGGFCELWLNHWSSPWFSNWSTCSSPEDTGDLWKHRETWYLCLSHPLIVSTFGTYLR